MPVANTRTWGRFSPSGPLNWAWGRFCCPKLFDEDGLRLLKELFSAILSAAKKPKKRPNS
jgi:hypothetical protein